MHLRAALMPGIAMLLSGSALAMPPSLVTTEWETPGRTLATGDFDADGARELLVGMMTASGRLEIREPDSGALGHEFSVFWGDGNNLVTHVEDLTGNGQDELAMFYRANPSSNRLGVFEWSAGAYQARWELPDINAVFPEVSSIDLFGNGLRHVVLIESTVRIHDVLNGDLIFDGASEYPGTPLTDIWIGDIDNDAREEILATRQDGGGTTVVVIGVSDAVAVPPDIIDAGRLSRNVPNPFRGPTRIDYTLTAESRAAIRIYDVSGRLVRTLVDETLPAGAHTAIWDGTGEARRPVAPGSYFYELEIDGAKSSRKMVRTR